MPRRITTSLVTALLLAATVFSGSTAANATTAALCDPPYYQNVSNGWAVTDGAQTMKVAPYASCATVAQPASRTFIYIWCFHENRDGYFWVYGRIAGTQTRGWMRLNDFFSYNYGSTGLRYC